MAPKTILLKGDPLIMERKAAAAITPGHLVELTSSDTVQKQATASLNSPRMFALENSLEGDEIGTAYAADERVQIAVCYGGCEVYAWLSDGETVVIGDELEAGTTDGELIKRSSGISIATALEASDLSASANSAAGRLKVLIH